MNTLVVKLIRHVRQTYLDRPIHNSLVLRKWPHEGRRFDRRESISYFEVESSDYGRETRTSTPSSPEKISVLFFIADYKFPISSNCFNACYTFDSPSPILKWRELDPIWLIRVRLTLQFHPIPPWRRNPPIPTSGQCPPANIFPFAAR
jgi:hypothetical protein